MTINPAGEASEKSWWVYTLLGVVLLFAGAFVLANLVFASAVSAIWIASAIIVAGVYQILRALKLSRKALSVHRRWMFGPANARNLCIARGHTRWS